MGRGNSFVVKGLQVLLGLMALAALVISGCRKTTPGVHDPTPSPSQMAATASGKCGSGKVVAIVDSTVIDVEMNGQVVRVKYYGIEAPSVSSESGDSSAFNFNRFLVAGQTIEMEAAPEQTDEDGNLLCFAYVNGDMVNREMLDGGYARVTSSEVTYKHLQSFLKAEADAESEQRGLWQPAPHDFLDIPYSRTPTTGQPFEGGTLPSFAGMPGIGSICDYSETTDAAIKGNVDSRTAQRTYYVPGSFFYETIAVSADDGDRWFCTEAEAAAAGWRKDKDH